MAIVKLTRNSQITIPKDIREKIGIKEGDRVEVSVEGDKVVIRKVDLEDITDFLPRDFEEIGDLVQYDVFISAVVAAEIFTGTYLRRDKKRPQARQEDSFHSSRLFHWILRLPRLLEESMHALFQMACRWSSKMR